MNALVPGLLLSAALAQLPPNHPPVPAQPPPAPSSAPQSGALPQGHPPVGGDTGQPPTQPAMPPDHPPIGGSSAQVPNHPPMRGGTAPSVEELMRRLDETPGLRERDKTFEIAMSVANLYHSNGRFTDAAEYFRQAWEIGKPVREAFKPIRGQAPAPNGCSLRQAPMQALLDGLATLPPAERTACIHTAMSAVIDAGESRAAALFLAGQPDEAIATLDAVLAEAPHSAEALFSRASILLERRGSDVKALQRARSDLQTLQQGHPQSPRAFRARALLTRIDEAIAAGGVQKLAAAKAADRRKNPPAIAAAAPPPPPQGGMPALSQETMEAFQKVQRTPELEQKLAKLVEEGEVELAKGRFEDALNRYRQVMPLDPENGRVRAGLAWAMVGLQRPAADRIWTVAVQSDPAAVEMLGVTLQANGDTQGAQQLWKRLADSAPDYARQTGLAERLK